MSLPLFYRIQPAGLGLDHTSESADDALSDGYVYAYASPEETFHVDSGTWGTYGAELVVFEPAGDPADTRFEYVYDPGDVEGVAVMPGKVVARFAQADWDRFVRTVIRADGYEVADDEDIAEWSINDWRHEIAAAIRNQEN